MAYKDLEDRRSYDRNYWHTVKKHKNGNWQKVLERQEAKKQRNREIYAKFTARTHQYQHIMDEYGISQPTVKRILREQRMLAQLENPMQVKEHYTPEYLYDYDGEIIRVLRTGREIKFSDVR